MNANSTQPGYSDRREERRERRAARGEWIMGIVLVALAGFMYLQNAKLYILNNWWALFILIPALGSFLNAWRHAREAGGRFTMRARGAIIFGLVLLAVAAMFLFGLNWTILGPALLAFAGLGMIINAIFKD